MVVGGGVSQRSRPNRERTARAQPCDIDLIDVNRCEGIPGQDNLSVPVVEPCDVIL